MRRVLVLGGTAWLGRTIAARAASSGAQVTCLARGSSGQVPEGATWVRADRSSPGAYDALDGDWDEVIEIAYEPDLVTGALDALTPRAAHWTLISSVSVYADNSVPFEDESATLVEPTDLTQYPDAKVAAERATRERIGDRLLIARPGLIVGAGDPSDRLGYWPARLALASAGSDAVLAPTLEGRHAQVIDVEDLAAWVVRAGAAAATGAVNAVGAVHTLGDVLEAAARVAEFSGRWAHADDDALLAADVRYWAGPRSLPLWLPADHGGFMRRSGARYLELGGTLTPLKETLERLLADERGRGLDRPRRSGLTRAEELEALATLP
ncbi:reductase [Demequina sp.]|uniref:reductase n=1 Tax=Demequina sp. TaxID=2050685 RepID=UPI003A8372B8